MLYRVEHVPVPRKSSDYMAESVLLINNFPIGESGAISDVGKSGQTNNK